MARQNAKTVLELKFGVSARSNTNRKPIIKFGENNNETLAVMKTLAVKKRILALVVLAMTAMAQPLPPVPPSLRHTAATRQAIVRNSGRITGQLTHVRTTGPNKLVKITYNAECVSGQPTIHG
jgi:hypothetical protein